MKRRDITVCLAYYDNPGMLARQIETFAVMGATARNHLRLIVVDDGSPSFPAEDVDATTYPAEQSLFDFRLYRMHVDIPWNQDACRNLAVSEADTEWVLLTDIDHLVPEMTFLFCIEHDLDPLNIYRFSRVTAPAMTTYKRHPNSWLMTRAMYDAVGGYDERYAGIYGTDGMFMTRCFREAAMVIDLPEVLIRCPRDFIPDASTTALERKSPENTARKIAKDREIEAIVAAGGDPRPQRLTFPWSRTI